jgi:hypothetical protein
VKGTFLKFAMISTSLFFAAFYVYPQSRSDADYPSWELEGMVEDSLGKPLDEAQVIVEAREKSTTRTDGKGHYILRGAKGGRYAVFARKSGYVFAQLRFVQVTPGMHVSLDLKLEREAVLSGRIVSRDGDAIAEAQITVWGREFDDGSPIFLPRGRAKTDDTGQYRVGGLSEGNYYVGVNSQPIETEGYRQQEIKQARAPKLAYPPLFYPRTQLLGDATPIYIRSAEQLEGVDLTLERVATFCVTGTVSAKGIFPESAEARLSLSETSNGWVDVVGGGPTKLDKKFEMCHLIPGIRYALSAQLWGDGSKLLGFLKKDFQGNREDVEFDAVDLGSLVVEFGQAVHGRVMIDGNQKDQTIPKNVLVTLGRTTPVTGYVNETRAVEAAPSGEFVLPIVFPYEHSLKILGLPPGYYVKEAECGRWNLLKEPWQPGCGEVLVLLGLDAGSISGQAVNLNHEPVAGAYVVLAPEEGPVKISVQQAVQDGRFEFSSVIPGKYHVTAVSGIPEAQVKDPDTLRDYLFDATELDLAPRGQRSLTLTVHIRP